MFVVLSTMIYVYSAFYSEHLFHAPHWQAVLVWINVLFVPLKYFVLLLQKANILKASYDEASTILNRKYADTSDARARAMKIAARANDILNRTTQQKKELESRKKKQNNLFFFSKLNAATSLAIMLKIKILLSFSFILGFR